MENRSIAVLLSAVVAGIAVIYFHWSKRSGITTSSKMVDQAVLEKLEAGFRKLQDAKDCKSLLKKHLTKEIFDKLKHKKTAMGATLLDVIQSGNDWFLTIFLYT
ncbi:arginine kinase-like, partial [Stegodyphus dumicola]|uniref:arginine kinase-like n=1 Tax=Stegodyphus dumicola TaxID=202533 RepID=UPI0015AD6FF8